MKLFNWFNKSGKMTTATVAGLTALGGAAVVGASLLYLQEPADNNSFNLGGDQNTNIVYASGSGRAYDYGAPGANGGEVGSSIRVTSTNIDRLDQQVLREQRREEMAESERDAAQAYRVSQGEGLRTGNTEYEGDQIATQNFGGQMQGMMANLQGMMAQATGGAQGAPNMPGMPGPQGQPAPGAAASQAAGGPAALQTAARKDWSHSAALGGRSGGSGQAGANQFVMQANGRGQAAGGDASAAMSQMGDVMRQAQEQARSLVGGGPKMQNSARFGSGANLDGGLDSFGRGRERAQSGDRITRAFKVSAEGSKNKNRAANEMGKAWLDSNRVTGGLTLDNGSTVNAGQGVASEDITGNVAKGMKNMQAKFDQLEDTALQRQEEAQELQSKLWNTITTTLVLCFGIITAVRIARSALIAWPFWVLAGVLTAYALYKIGSLLVAANTFGAHWGHTGLTTTSKIVSGVLVAAVGISWLAAVKWVKQMGSTAMKFLGIKPV